MPPPTAFTDAEGVKYPFHSDCREWIRAEKLIQDTQLPEKMKMSLLFCMIFPNGKPDVVEGMKYIRWFLACGDVKTSAADEEENHPRYYDFDNDFPYIYAAFLQFYGIDLIDVKYLHWFKFSALLSSLPECKFTDIVSYRNAKIPAGSTKEFRQRVADYRRIYALEENINDKRMFETTYGRDVM
jgi:hypothetical protein